MVLFYNHMQAAQLKYGEIKLGMIYEFGKVITKEDGLQFSALTGDYNALHVDAQFGVKSQFGNNVVHGMLAASFFSTLVGMYCPGRNALYMRQMVEFRHPLYYGDQIIVRGIVTAKHDALQMVTLKTEIIRAGKVVVDGEARVRVLE